MSARAQTFNFDTNSAYLTNDYDAVARHSVPGYISIFQMALALFRSSLPEDAALLIVGAGGGSEVVTFGEAQPLWHITGVDPSEQMLAAAREKIAARGLTERIHLHRGVVQELAPDPVFDAATCILTLHILPDDASKMSLLRNVAARLKPGGKFVLVSLAQEKGTAAFDLFAEAWQRHAEDKGAPAERTDEMKRIVVERIHPASEERTIGMLCEAGFGEVVRFYAALWYGGWIATKA